MAEVTMDIMVLVGISKKGPESAPLITVPALQGDEPQKKSTLFPAFKDLDFQKKQLISQQYTEVACVNPTEEQLKEFYDIVVLLNINLRS